jgi:hypothetical protein
MSEDSIYFLLDELTRKALQARADYIVEHAASIYVRVKIGERWENYPVSELRGTMAITEAFRLLLRAEVPVRKISLTRGEAI